MPTIPTGTVTFLFTDIEGSTRLWEVHPAWMQGAFQRQEAILRQVIADHGGYAYKMIGDAFQAAFQTATDALAASIAAQRALAGEAWGSPGPLRVRMALHTGTVEERGDDYVGPVLNRIARLLATGYGGQILLTRTTVELVRDALPPHVVLHDLGEHRLKDLSRPEHIFQVDVPDLPSDFRPLRTLDLRRNNLPVQRDALVGRERELDAVATLLRRDEVGLVTLTGPGGTGKTRLSLQVAADLLDSFPDGVWFVDLSPISDPDLVVSTIATTVGVKETGDQPLVEALIGSFRDKRLLLVLDNFEQVVAAAPLVADLLQVTPGLRFLVTSRATLHVTGEYEFSVPPLALPDAQRLPPVVQLAQYPAIALFVQRAQAVKPDFRVTNENAPAVAEICHRLDGLPLAIELAAARVKLFAPSALLPRLTHRLKTLTSGARNLPARQQTLRGAIDWSYDLLAPEEQSLFAQLGVFVSGCSIEAAEAVCEASDDNQIEQLDGLASLADKSLVRQVEGLAGEPRFFLLETLREYALERLEASGVMETLGQRHARYFLTLVETAEPELTGPDQGRWFEQLAVEHDNLRAAIGWALEHGEAELAARITAPLWRFWVVDGHITEGRRWLERTLALKDALSEPLHANVLRSAGALAYWQGDYAQAMTSYGETLALYRALGDKANEVDTLLSMSTTATWSGDTETGGRLADQALPLFEALGLRGKVGMTLMAKGFAYWKAGAIDQALPLWQQSLAIALEVGDEVEAATKRLAIATMRFQQGAREEALESALQALAQLAQLKNMAFTVMAIDWVAALVAQEETEESVRLAGAAEALRTSVGGGIRAEASGLPRVREVAAARLDGATIERLWNEGQQFRLEQATVCAQEVGAHVLSAWRRQQR